MNKPESKLTRRFEPEVTSEPEKHQANDAKENNATTLTWSQRLGLVLANVALVVVVVPITFIVLMAVVAVGAGMSDAAMAQVGAQTAAQQLMFASAVSGGLAAATIILAARIGVKLSRAVNRLLIKRTEGI